MNNYIWLENRYLLPEKERGSDLNSLKDKCHNARTSDGKQVYIYKEGFENLPDEIKEAFKNLERLKDFQNKTWDYICRDRRAENLKRLLPQDILSNIVGYLDDSTKIASAFASQHFKKYAGRVDFKNVCANAAKDGHLEILKWARANSAPWDVRTCTFAAEEGHLEILKWARANGAPWDERTCAFAARKGRLEVLKWARANGSDWNEWTCAYAVDSGRTCNYAAENGHLEVLKWARENGAKWSSWTCVFAARGDHLEVLKWARANGAPWDIHLIRSYASPEILEWLMRNP